MSNNKSSKKTPKPQESRRENLGAEIPRRPVTPSVKPKPKK